MNSTKFLTLLFCLAAFAALSQATNTTSIECHTGTAGFYTKIQCPSNGCQTTETFGIKTKSCLLSNQTSLCGKTVSGVSTTCCYTSLCNSGFSVNMSPFHLLLVVASYLIYARLA